MLERHTRLRELNDALEGDKQLNQVVYQNLMSFCAFLTSIENNMSQIQFEEEYDALLLVVAYVKGIPNQTQTPESEEENKLFKKFLNKLSDKSFDPSLIYSELIDWGCYFQKIYYSYSLCFQKILPPGIDNNFDQRFRDREASRKQSYEWYADTYNRIKRDVTREKILLRFSPLFFLVPLSLCLVTTTHYVCEKDPSKTAGDICALFWRSFLMSIPVINCIAAVWLGCKAKNKLKTHQEELQQFLRQENNLIVTTKMDPLIVTTKKMDQNDTVAFKSFKKQFKKDNSYRKEYAVQGKSRPKKFQTDADTVVVYVDAAKAEREKFYREKWKQSKSCFPQKTKDSNVTFFGSLNQSKRKSREISNQVLKLHEEKFGSPAHEAKP